MISSLPKHYQRYTPNGLIDGDPVTLSTLLILEAAIELGIEVNIIPGTKIIQLEHYQTKKYFRYQISTETTDIGFYSCLDKGVTNSLLLNAGVTIPKGYSLKPNDNEQYRQTVFDSLVKPLVVKPTLGNQGNAITVGIQNYDTYQHAVEKAFAFSNDKEAGVLVEEMFTGNEYRILVTREKVLGIVYRMPANVVGDGTSTIQELIDLKNADPRRGKELTYALFIIEVDEEILRELKQQNVTLESIPDAGQRIFLRKISNISKGGDSIDVTDIAHPDIHEIAIKAINSLPGLDFAGLDLMTTNIEAPQTSATHRVIEINSSPGFCIQEFPFLGEPRKAQYEFIYLAFPELRP